MTDACAPDARSCEDIAELDAGTPPKTTVTHAANIATVLARNLTRMHTSPNPRATRSLGMARP
ncbi:hypothetical protein BN13_330019 [Nostocoides jenkinsii Ben 74]|uniref:Uncharacterized protein n=1 Tax=Nostocoides jenkinsii Ben 74 TaxID=1193518 RepID=A0A077M7I4_9MICO|nr:hypothetical protein BN13_330019 [Tetrasphaera jenkinsii Ben 74]